MYSENSELILKSQVSFFLILAKSKYSYLNYNFFVADIFVLTNH